MSAIAADRASGRKPFAVVGTAGTINTGAVDDLHSLADVAAREGLWFHDDGAFGALAVLSPETRGAVAGIERADSLAFDFPKWMHVPYEAGYVLVRDRQACRQSFDVANAYLRPLDRGPACPEDSSDLEGPQLSRGFKALKVWLTLKKHGLEKSGRLVAQNVRQARFLGGLLDASPFFVRVARVTFNVVVFGREPGGCDRAVAEQVNQVLLVRLQEGGIAVPSATVLDGRFTLRVCVCNHRSRKEDFRLLVREAESIVLDVRADLGLE